jgi:hypothetical protein
MATESLSGESFDRRRQFRVGGQEKKALHIRGPEIKAPSVDYNERIFLRMGA